MLRRTNKTSDADKAILEANPEARKAAMKIGIGSPISHEENELIKAVNAKLSTPTLITVEGWEKINGKTFTNWA